MKQTLWLVPCILILMAVMAGCGRTTNSGNVTFSDEQLTAFAGTAQASVQQTAQAASPTPVPPTATPLISPISGTSLVTREDQTTLFMDHRAGIQLAIPAGWLTIRVNEDEFYKAFTNEAVMANQAYIDHLTDIQDGSIDTFRLDAIDIRPGHLVDDIVTYMTVIFQKDDIRTLEEWRQAERASKKPFKGYKFLTSVITRLDNGTEVLIIEESWNGSGASTIYYRGVFFILPTGTVVLDFYCNQAFKDDLLPDFEQMVNSLSPINP